MAKISRKPRKGSSGAVTMISISVPMALVAKIDALAAAQNRNRSNFIVNVIEKVAAQRLGK